MERSITEYKENKSNENQESNSGESENLYDRSFIWAQTRIMVVIVLETLKY